MTNQKIKRGELLSTYTTLRIGGPAAFLAEASSEDELKNYIHLAQKENKECLIIGEGSNLLVNDKGFDGFVIVNKIEGIRLDSEKVSVMSGTKLQTLVDTLIENGLSGMEKMTGIPGTIGGAVYGNAGAYGQTISDKLLRVKVLKGGKVEWVSKKDCKFGYRESIFKKNKEIILEVEFNFDRASPDRLRKESKEVLSLRLKKYKPGIMCPGSFFKNLEASKVPKKSLAKIPKDKIIYGKVPAGYLLEEVGTKGKRLGRIQIAEFHGNLFMNLGRGTASDFYNLAKKYKGKVKEKFGIDLEPEVQLIGFDKNVAILGLGLEGRDLVSYLGRDAELTILDRQEESKLDFSGVDKSKVTLRCGENYLSGGLEGFDIVYRSPGVYRYLPEIVRAEEAGVEISSAIKLFFESCPAHIIGVTGTKGKGTTATLIYQILRKVGKKVFLAGNIGKPYLELLSKLTKDSWTVLELSSFQLIDLTKSPNVAVVLNITADHLDWHKDLKEYIDAKKNIVRYQSASDWAVVNSEYKTSKGFSKETEARVVFFSKGKLEDRFKKNLLLRGEHNLENIAAAVAVGKILGVDEGRIQEVVSSFKGLEHRLELVGEIDERTFYNDSFATGPQPTIAAIKSFSEPITLILGGSEKGLDFSELGKIVAGSSNVENVILIGLVGPRIGEAIKRAGYKGNIVDMGSPKMTEIVTRAFELTPKGGVVLLSPGAASFDMFKNYKDRGEQFKKAVKKLE